MFTGSERHPIPIIIAYVFNAWAMSKLVGLATYPLFLVKNTNSLIILLFLSQKVYRKKVGKWASWSEISNCGREIDSK